MSRINTSERDEAKPMTQAATLQRPDGAKRGLLRTLALAVVLAVGFLVAGIGQLSAQAATADGKTVIVLDAGHGGRDPGAVDPVNGYTEADIVQAMNDKLYGLLAQHEEVELVTTHAPGSYVSINERTDVAKRANADLFVSLHLNAAENTSASGFQIFPAPPGREYHEESMRLAQSIVDHVVEIGRPMMGTNGIYYAFYRGSEKDFYDAATFNKVDNRSSFGVVEGAGCPSVLVENWFITNRGDMEMFNNAEGQDLMARQLYRGICEYLGLTALA